MTAPADIGAWMLEEIEQGGHLDQFIAVRSIQELYGEEFVYRNTGAEPGNCPAVLRAFNKVSGDRVIWCRTSKRWEMRKPGQRPGRSQDC